MCVGLISGKGTCRDDDGWKGNARLEVVESCDFKPGIALLIGELNKVFFVASSSRHVPLPLVARSEVFLKDLACVLG